MPPEVLSVVKATIASGARIDLLNIMTMSYYTNSTNLGQLSIDSAQATMKQLMTLYPGKTQAQAYAMLGVTPMIGMNDDNTIFTLADAQLLANFVKQNGIGRIGFWAFQRDQAQSKNGLLPLNSYSSVVQSDFQFYNIFKNTAGGSAPAQVHAPVRAPAAVPTPAPSQPATGSCNLASTWVYSKNYSAGDIVKYKDGNYYIAAFANPGYDPTISTYFWKQHVCASAVAVNTCSGASIWKQGAQYAAGATVKYSNGNFYTAKFANPGYNPTISTYYWGRNYCN